MITETYTDCDNCISEGCNYLSDSCKCFNVTFSGDKIIGVKLLNNTLCASQINDLINNLADKDGNRIEVK